MIPPVQPYTLSYKVQVTSYNSVHKLLENVMLCETMLNPQPVRKGRLCSENVLETFFKKFHISCIFIIFMKNINICITQNKKYFNLNKFLSHHCLVHSARLFFQLNDIKFAVDIVSPLVHYYTKVAL